jgi:hypothetical protein
MRKAGYCLTALGVLALIFFAAPRPAECVDQWQLDFKHETPKLFRVPVADKYRNVHYCLYTVENKTDRDVPLDLVFKLSTDTKKKYYDYIDVNAENAIIRAEADLLNNPFYREDIKKLKAEKKFLNRREMNGTYIFKEVDGDIIVEKSPEGILKPGEKRQGLVVFDEIDLNADRIILHVNGLVENTKVERREIVSENKEYRVYYERPGDEFYRALDKMKLVKDAWVVLDIPADNKDPLADVKDEFTEPKKTK